MPITAAAILNEGKPVRFLAIQWGVWNSNGQPEIPVLILEPFLRYWPNGGDMEDRIGDTAEELCDAYQDNLPIYHDDVSQEYGCRLRPVDDLCRIAAEILAGFPTSRRTARSRYRVLERWVVVQRYVGNPASVLVFDYLSLPSLEEHHL